VFIRKNNLYVFYSRIGDVPERILVSKIRLTNDWNNWIPSEPTTILEPLLGYEGINEPLKKSVAGASYTPVRELRDPAIFKDNRKTYLLYSISGELGIAIAELKFEKILGQSLTRTIKLIGLSRFCTHFLLLRQLCNT